jgi:glycosyltransferase involved in cell wall biosynthesis
MKLHVGYCISPGTFLTGLSNGIRSQALRYKNMMEEKGHTTTLINPWEIYQIKDYDVIHIFGSGYFLNQLVPGISKRKIPVILSPILDSPTHPSVVRLKSMLGVRNMKLVSSFSTIRAVNENITGYFARSEYEKKLLIKGFGIEPTKIQIIPVSLSGDVEKESQCEKKQFCLHVSSLYQKRKNVARLITAAGKVGVHLKLAGSMGNKTEETRLRDLVRSFPNVELLGFVTDEQLIQLYNEAKCFALPSLYEGVGIVALDAAAHGCDIVLTERGGPKEYYNNMAYLVNPKNVDAISDALVNAISNTHQPGLQSHIISNFNAAS